MEHSARPIARQPQSSALRRQVVDRAEAHVRAHLATPMSIGLLSRLVGCSERALRNAFYGVHGVGPKQWIRSEQLESARQALIMANGTSMTVTIVATEHGFNELGRFAATYRRAFGEPPSETLRGGRRKLAAAATTEGQAHVCTT